MIGLLKDPLPIYQSFCKEIRNTWNIHINEILKKASKGIYFLVQLKRAKVTRRALLAIPGLSLQFALIFNARIGTYTEESNVHHLPQC